MNRLLRFVIPSAVAIFYSFLPATLQADIIAANVTGPGGIGVVPACGGTLAEPSLSFTGIAFLDVNVTLDSPGTSYISETPTSGTVNNSTGEAWSRFTWQIISESSASFVYDPSSAAFSSLEFSSTFPTVDGPATFATFSGGTLNNGSNFQPAFDFVASQAGTYKLRQISIPVPKPSTRTLMTAGAASLVYRQYTSHGR